LKRRKRPKVYGDGTELDDFEDLPLDGDKETRFRIQPKVARVPGASYPKPPEKEPSSSKNTLQRNPTREPSSNNLRGLQPSTAVFLNLLTIRVFQRNLNPLPPFPHYEVSPSQGPDRFVDAETINGRCFVEEACCQFVNNKEAPSYPQPWRRVNTQRSAIIYQYLYKSLFLFQSLEK
jgi:hypothetical protein